MYITDINSPMNPRARCWFLVGSCLLCLVLTLAVYYPGASGSFHSDDFLFIVHNPHIRSLSHAPSFFVDKTTLSFTGHGIYRPLRTLSYSLDYFFFGQAAPKYHAVNMILHAGVGMLLFALLLRLFKGEWMVSMVLALLFLLHPVQTETVNWISSRGDLLSAFFLLAALLTYIASESRRGLLLCLLIYACALCSKETAVMLPAVMLLVDRVLRKRWCWLRVMPYCGLALVYLLVRYAVLGQVQQQAYWGGSFLYNQCIMTRAWQRYLGLIFWPSELRVVYMFDFTFSSLRLWVLALLVLLLLLGGIWGFSKASGKLPVLGLAWFFLFLLPVSNLIPIKGLLNEHLLYLPLIGVLLMLGALLSSARVRPIKHHLCLGCLAIAAVFGLQSNQRSRIWGDTLLLWQDTVKKTPGHPVAQGALGMAYKERGQLQDAYQSFARALQVVPDYYPAQYQLAEVAFRLKKYEQARVLASRLYADHQDKPDTVILYGQTLAASGESSAALQVFKRGLEAHPQEAELRRLLAASLEDLQQWTRALEAYQHLLTLRPDSIYALHGVGRCYHYLEDYTQSERYLRKVLDLEPTDMEARQGMVTVLLALGKRQAAHSLVLELEAEGIDIPPFIRQAVE